jgi:hypothetical protein
MVIDDAISGRPVGPFIGPDPRVRRPDQPKPLSGTQYLRRIVRQTFCDGTDTNHSETFQPGRGVI